MSTTVFAIEGKLGSTKYYVVTMKASEVVSKIRIPKEVEGWEYLDIENRYQREINDLRVKRDIAPYLANDKDRFFGSLLVAMQHADQITFEPLTDVATKLPVAYKTPAAGAGFLTLTGGEVMFPIDGQHRLRAIKYAIDGRDSAGKDLDLTPSTGLAQDDVVVVLFKFETDISRKIFSKVNRYARTTTKAQNLITDDDDVIAVITREIANDVDVIGARMVNFKSNTLSNMAVEFTTLATLYDCIDYIISADHGKIDKSVLPDPQKKKLLYRSTKQVIQTLVDKIEHFETMLTDTGGTGDEKRRELRQETLLSKPISQLCLVRAFVNIQHSKTSDNRTPTEDEICGKLNQIDWDMKNPSWQKILMNGNKIMAGKGTVNLATEFIVYLAGFLPTDKVDDLFGKYLNSFTEEERKHKSLEGIRENLVRGL